MPLITVLSTISNWSLADYMNMKVSELLEWEGRFKAMQDEERRRDGK